MSNSFVVEPQEGSSKKDDTLILMVNDNGVISVDQDTLQNLILNQTNASVSVVRLGQTENDAAEGNITLTVDPPQYVSSEANLTNTSGDPAALVDPFMEMDPEQLERLETALQSEEAKQILGENVTAMLDMLTVEEQQNSIRYSIELDHCYTSRFSPTQPKLEPLPDLNCSDMDESICTEVNKSTLSPSSSNNINSTSLKQKVISMPPKIVKQPVSIGGRPRRASTAMQGIANNSKSTVSTNAHTSQNSSQQESNLQIKDEEEAEDNEIFSSSESSESEESDSDSDFGPKSSRKGVRFRGGRRGLTTRGGSTAASRRRGSNKHMDRDQVRRLDFEMAAAVNAMKSPEKEDKSDRQSQNLNKSKKQIKTMGGKKKEETPIPAIPVNEPPPVEMNVLQTTNQVKANLISSNMIKGDMILTKPGQDRQKVVFVQKQVVMNPNEMKAVGIKKQVIIPKTKPVAPQDPKLPTIKSMKVLSSPMIIKTPMPGTQHALVIRQNVNPSEVKPAQTPGQPLEPASSVTVKTKHVEVKKEKKKVENNSDSPVKIVNEPSKAVESKTAIVVPKKFVKKEHRKSETHVVEPLGPALFSTPDIIRRVGSTGESKISEGSVATTPTITPVMDSADDVFSVQNTSGSATTPTDAVMISDQPIESNMSVDDSANNTYETKLNSDISMLSESLEDKIDEKVGLAELLQPALDAATNPSSSKEMPPSLEQTNNPKHIVPDSGIEGDEHLLATLGMEAAKQLPNDEELLAEALLLQETLGVDLDNAALVDPPSEISDNLMSSAIMEPSSVSVSQEVTSPIKVDSSPIMPLPEPMFTVPVKNELGIKKESKEPIQIVRGGRVITLPPIEAPATRSKRLQTKTGSPQQTKIEKKAQIQQQQQQQQQQKQQQVQLHEHQQQQQMKIQKIEPSIIKNERSTRTPTHVSLKKQDMIYDMGDDDEDDQEDEAVSDSEDDPNRLWCICRQPHNNRFMICCDMCQEWFHGKCVHVTKSMGEEMEKQGIEWVCPNCLKKKNDDGKTKSNPKRRKSNTDTMSNDQNRTPSNVNASPVNELKATPNTGRNPGGPSSVTHCVVCKKEARKASIYCSDACILAHAQVTSTKDKPSPLPLKTPQLKTDTPKLKSDTRIIVYCKKTGKVLTGVNAPTASNVKAWLKEHPTYEIVKSHNLNTVQLGGKATATISTQGIKTNKPLQASPMPGQAKMIYTKVPGSKQTALISSSKKTVLLTDTPPVRPAASPLHRPKPIAAATTAIKTSTPNKQTVKIVQQQQLQTPSQKPSATSTPKPTAIRKPYEVKASTSQIKKEQPQQPKELKEHKEQKEQKELQTPPPRKPETEPIRLNVRKTLSELLSCRIKETKDLTLTEEEILELALQIELEMFKFFKDTGLKYKSKYRSLVFNIKDTKNLTLFRKIADRSLTPDAVVKLSPEEMASQELAEWREKETKHQLEMIKKNELDLMAQAKSIVVKTHKGEQIIENDKGIDVDPKTPVQDIVTALNSGDNISSTVDDSKKSIDEKKLLDDSKKKDKEKDRDREKRRDRSRDRNKSSHRHRDRSKDKKSKKDSKHKDRTRDKSRDKKKDEEKDKDKKKKDKDRKDKHSRNSSSNHNKNRHKDKDKDKSVKKEDEKKADITIGHIDKTIDDRLWKHIEEETSTNTLDGNESDISDREPSSTVNIKTPDINEELEKDVQEQKVNENVITVWRGFVFMTDVAKFFVTAQNVGGNSKELMEGVPDSLDVVGRINPETVWDYLGKMKKNASKEIIIIKLTATNDEEKIPYITLYSYLNSRNRLGVLGNVSPNIKDFYIMPFSNKSTLPSVLLPLDGPGFEENRQHLLLGIIVMHSRKKRPAIGPSLGPPLKIVKKDPTQQSDRSFTPPPNSVELRLPTHEHKLSSSLSVMSKIVPEFSTKMSIDSSTSSDKMPLDDDDEPYSPGEPVNVVIDDNEDALSSPSSSLQVKEPSKSSTDLQRKVDELNRQIEEEKMQIQNISSSFLSDASTTLPGLGLDPPDSNDGVEAYSPSDSRSFTPPPQGISKLSQPILEKVSDITIPPNLQEILANVKRQESSKVDPYLPSKPTATFLTTASSSIYHNSERYSPPYNKTSVNKSTLEVQSSPRKEPKSTLSSLSDAEILRKAEEQLAAMAAASADTQVQAPPGPATVTPTTSPACSELPPIATSFDAPHR